MNSEANTRRQFLKLSGASLGALGLSTHIPLLQAFGKQAQLSHQQGASFENINSILAANIAAVCEQIFPTDESPGAKEIGVIYFIDKVWNDLIGADSKLIEKGLYEIELHVKANTKSNKQFSDLEFDLQKNILEKFETQSFFQTLHFWTIAGLFSMPKYGGNKNQLGWDLLGFDHRHVWTPPFGYYDQHAHEQLASSRNVK